jgi:hypothetical protein
VTGKGEKQSLKGLIFTSIRNKILVGVILFCMLVNGFVPRSIESKESLFVVMSAVVSNAIVEVFNECRDTLTIMSNKITKDLYKFLMLGEVGAEAANKGEENKDPMPINTSSDSGIVVERDDYEQIISYRVEKGKIIIAAGKIEEDLYMLYRHIKGYCIEVSSKIGILFFLMFVIAIRRRKAGAAGNNNLIRIEEYKTNLC